MLKDVCILIYSEAVFVDVLKKIKITIFTFDRDTLTFSILLKNKRHILFFVWHITVMSRVTCDLRPVAEPFKLGDSF